MHRRPFFLLALTSLASSRLHSLPEDTHAFPKYSVDFLNHLPVLNRTAERWLTHGLRGGESEFLDQPWKEDSLHTPVQRKEIGSGDTQSDTQADARSYAGANYTIEHMKMGSKDSYLCFIPKPSEATSTRYQEEAETDATPARSWSLLQPLSGTCLYHRQGWFTYSYCHNQAIRQFKELAQPVSRIPGTYEPEEDQDWESYTLGRAPRSAEDTGADLTVAERNAQAANLELARNAGSRYLVQRWGDGTLCDKTGKPREVEVQFHCSMATTDHILFVKEAKTCSYVLVIHTPRLCGEPGFKSRRDSSEETLIRCREIVDTLPTGDKLGLPRKYVSDQPFKIARRNTVLPPPQPKAKTPPPTTQDDPASSKDDLYNKLLKNALEAILKGTQGEKLETTSNALKEAIEDGEVIVEFVDPEEEQTEHSKRVIDALRAAGWEVQSNAFAGRKAGKGSDDKKEASSNSKEGSNSPPPKAKGRLHRVLQEHMEL